MVHLRKTAINNSTSEKKQQLCVDLQLGWTSKNSDLGGGKQKEEEDGYLHQNKEGGEEEQRGPLHPVQDDLKVLHVGQNQKPESTENGDPTWRQRGGKRRKKNILEITERSSAWFC